MRTGTVSAGAVDVESGSAFTDVSDETCRIADHQSVRGYAPCDNRARADHGESADADAGQDGAASANRRALSDDYAGDTPVFGTLEMTIGSDCARPSVVEKARVGPDENTISQPGSLEDRDTVLQLDAIANNDARVDVHALAEHAVGTDPRSVSYLCLVPNLSAVAHTRGIRDLSGRMDCWCQ